MKFCFTSISRESFTSARRFMDSPASSRASPGERMGWRRKPSQEALACAAEAHPTAKDLDTRTENETRDP